MTAKYHTYDGKVLYCIGQFSDYCQQARRFGSNEKFYGFCCSSY